jgi:hypothetical protein
VSNARHRALGANEMGESDRNVLLAWYAEQKDVIFDNRHVLEKYCQNDVTVLRETCHIFGRDFMEFANIDVFLEAVTIALHAIRCCVSDF